MKVDMDRRMTHVTGAVANLTESMEAMNKKMDRLENLLLKLTSPLS